MGNCNRLNGFWKMKRNLFELHLLMVLLQLLKTYWVLQWKIIKKWCLHAKYRHITGYMLYTGEFKFKKNNHLSGYLKIKIKVFLGIGTEVSSITF